MKNAASVERIRVGGSCWSVIATNGPPTAAAVPEMPVTAPASNRLRGRAGKAGAHADASATTSTSSPTMAAIRSVLDHGDQPDADRSQRDPTGQRCPQAGPVDVARPGRQLDQRHHEPADEHRARASAPAPPTPRTAPPPRRSRSPRSPARRHRRGRSSRAAAPGSGRAPAPTYAARLACGHGPGRRQHPRPGHPAPRAAVRRPARHLRTRDPRRSDRARRRGCASWAAPRWP